MEKEKQYMPLKLFEDQEQFMIATFLIKNISIRKN